MTDLRASPLGHAATYTDRYDPALLFTVERAPLRAELGIANAPPFFGEDVWNAYELSWLDPRGKPQVAIVTFRVPAHSPRIVESKSVKLYLTAFNQTRFASDAEVRTAIARDLGSATGADVAVTLYGPDAFATLPRAEPAGRCLDDLPLELDADGYTPDPDALSAGAPIVRETLFTRLFRSMCPVTGQPDYACIVIAYEGSGIDHGGLLRYLVSFRRHAGFHEHCVERIYADIVQRCRPVTLAVHARFTRRGGVDINPYRSSVPFLPAINARTARQ